MSTTTPAPWPPPDADGVLLVIAHPDDEAMFFAPAVTAATGGGVGGGGAGGGGGGGAPRQQQPPRPPFRLLCLSTGNADGLGRTRARELVRAAGALGVPEDRVTVLDDPRLRDGMRERWGGEAVAGAVAAELRRAAAAVEGGGGGSRSGRGWALLTFDGRGVSGHPNHRDTSAGVLELALASAARGGGGSDDKKRRSAADNNNNNNNNSNRIHSVWQLRSEPLALKFLGPVGAALSVVRLLLLRSVAASAVAVVPARQPVLASLRAMRLHASQWVWFRWLFVAFSSYGWVNVLERVVAGCNYN